VLFHRTEVKLHNADNDYHYNGEECVEVKGNGADKQGQAVLALNNAGNCSCPAGNGSYYTNGSCGSVDDICQLSAGYLELIGNGTHYAAHGKTVEVVIDEN